MYTLEGVSSIEKVITAYEESQQNRNSHFLSVFPKACFFTFYVL